MNIVIPANNISERLYILEVIMKDILGYNYDIHISKNVKNYIIIHENKEIVIEDHFFSEFSSTLSYLNRENLPNECHYLSCNNLLNYAVVIIYGQNKLDIGSESIICGLDIFASAFFMLTRWEELFLPKDKFGRCNENEMFVVKNKLYDRAIVNEYIELLKKLFSHLEISAKERTYRFQPFITHDIDYLFRYASIKNFCQNLVGDILHRKSIKTFFQTCKNYVLYRLGKIKDPFDTFDEFMNLSDRYGFKNAFFFKAAVRGEYDATYNIQDKNVGLIINKIIRRGHEVGFHPSKSTFHNPDQFKREIMRLQKAYPEIRGGRQHFLLYDIPETLHIWNDNGLEYDAGLGFAFRGGFRCGICYAYPFFSVLKREKLKLKIRPLIVMEGALLQFSTEKPLDVIEQDILNLIDSVYKYNGEFVFLWHNDHFKRYEVIGSASIYKRIVDYIGNKVK